MRSRHHGTQAQYVYAGHKSNVMSMTLMTYR